VTYYAYKPRGCSGCTKRLSNLSSAEADLRHLARAISRARSPIAKDRLIAKLPEAKRLVATAKEHLADHQREHEESAA
jgi:plasmid stabilization system protein ParE